MPFCSTNSLTLSDAVLVVKCGLQMRSKLGSFIGEGRDLCQFPYLIVASLVYWKYSSISPWKNPTSCVHTPERPWEYAMLLKTVVASKTHGSLNNGHLHSSTLLYYCKSHNWCMVNQWSPTWGFLKLVPSGYLIGDEQASTGIFTIHSQATLGKQVFIKLHEQRRND